MKNLLFFLNLPIRLIVYTTLLIVCAILNLKIHIPFELFFILCPFISYLVLFYVLPDPTIKERLNNAFNLIFIICCCSETLNHFIKEDLDKNTSFIYVLIYFLNFVIQEFLIEKNLEKTNASPLTLRWNDSLDLSFLNTRNNLYHHIKDDQLHIENLDNGKTVTLTNKPVNLNENNNISTHIVFPDSIQTKIFSKPRINKDKKINNLFFEYFLCIKDLFVNKDLTFNKKQ